MKPDDIKDYVIHWNSRFPIDRWWRKKYNVAFNSSVHRESSFIDQLIEFEEDRLFESFLKGNEYKAGTGDWLKLQVPKTEEESIQQLRDEFKDLGDE